MGKRIIGFSIAGAGIVKLIDENTPSLSKTATAVLMIVVGGWLAIK